MRVVIDTNCLLASIPPESPYYWLYLAFEKGLFEWVISNDILHEYEEILARKYSKQTAELVINILSVAPNTLFATPHFYWNLINNDPDDNKFADIAIATAADFLVSNDKDFNILKTIDFPKVNVVTLQVFKEMIDKANPLWQ